MSRWSPDSYRGGSPQPPSELERLAREGQQRYAQHAAHNTEAADRAGLDNLRVALGAAFGTPARRALVGAHYALIAGFFALLALSLAGMLPVEKPASVLMPIGLAAYLLVFVRAFTAPRASLARCDEEARWTASLPFALGGYLEALRAPPSGFSRVAVEVTFANPSATARPDLMLAAARAHDPGLSDFSIQPGRMRWLSSPISGLTVVRVNRVSVYRNHRIPPFVHGLIERTLLPMHRELPFAAVSLTRR